MGNAASKAAKRQYPQTAQHLTRSDAPLARPSIDPNVQKRQEEQQQHPSKPAHEHEHADFLERLKKLGPVDTKPTHKPQHIKQDNEVLGTLKAREYYQQKAKEAREERQDAPHARQPQEAVPPGTITSILHSIKEGDNAQQLQEDYNLSHDFLARMGSRFSVPQPQADKSVASQEARSMHQPRQKSKPDMDQVRQPKKFDTKTLEV